MTELTVPLDKLVTVRRHDGRIEIQDLVVSIAAVGMLVPLLVSDNHDGTYTILSGNRRYAALKSLKGGGIQSDDTLNYDAISCFLVDEDKDPDLVVLAANVQEDFPPSILGQKFVDLIVEGGFKPRTLAQVRGITLAKVELHMALAGSDKKIRKKVDKGELSLTAFKALRDAPAEVKQDIAQREGVVTVSQTKTAIKQAKWQDAGQALVPDEPSIVERLNEIHDYITGLVTSGKLGIRERHVLGQIHDITGEINDDK